MDQRLDRGSITVKIYQSLAKKFNLRKASPFLLWFTPLAFLLIFYFFPLGNILWISFTRSESGPVTPFIEALQSSSIRGVLWFTIWQATISTLLTLIVGLPGAYLIGRYKFRGKGLIRALTGVPFVMPTLVVAAGFNALLGPRGWINASLQALLQTDEIPIQFMNTLAAIFIAHVFYNTTIVLRMVGDFWSNLDPRFTQAARVLGANRWQTLRKTTLPLLAPVIRTAALLIFIFDFTSFGVILVLGGPQYATLEVEIYYQTISLFNLPLAAVLSVYQLLFTLFLTWTYTHLSARLSRPISLRSKQYTQKPLQTTKRKIMAAVILISLLTLLVSPLIALAARSVTHLGTERTRDAMIESGFTLSFYQELSENRQESLFYAPPTTAITISITYAFITVIMALGLGMPASWALVRTQKSRISRVLDPILMLPLGTSSVTLGLGFIVALSQPPLDLRTSPILVPIAHTLVAFPFVVRSLSPALRSIQPRIRQAAATMGATPLQVIRHIDIPLIGRALLVAGIFAFTISIGEFGATALISRPEYPTVPVMIYRFLSRPGALNYGQALALSTILMLVTTFGMLVIERFRIANIGEF